MLKLYLIYGFSSFEEKINFYYAWKFSSAYVSASFRVVIGFYPNNAAKLFLPPRKTYSIELRNWFYSLEAFMSSNNDSVVSECERKRSNEETIGDLSGKITKTLHSYSLKWLFYYLFIVLLFAYSIRHFFKDNCALLSFSSSSFSASNSS